MEGNSASRWQYACPGHGGMHGGMLSPSLGKGAGAAGEEQKVGETRAKGTFLKARMERAYLHAPFKVAVCDSANETAGSRSGSGTDLAGDMLARLFGLTASDFQIAGLNRAPEQTLNCPVALSQPFSNVCERCL